MGCMEDLQMTLNQAEKLKVGDKVIWPDGVNGCKEAIGTVTYDDVNNCNFVVWDDGQKTWLHDADAVQHFYGPLYG